MRAAVGVAALVASSSCFALQYPKPAGDDPRIRTVEYDDTESVALRVAPGVITKVIFGKGEVIVGDGLGKEAFLRVPGTGWAQIRIDKNHVAEAGGNWIVTTNKRSYNFELEVVKASDAVRQLRFTYPETAAASSPKRVEQVLSERTGATYNLCYVQTGDSRIRVVHAWDDGLQTWMRFEGEQPSIYALTTDGKEVVADYTMQSPGLINIPRVARSWVLRAGDAVKRVDAYDNRGGVCVAASGPYSPRHTYTGTVSQQVERVVKEAP